MSTMSNLLKIRDSLNLLPDEVYIEINKELNYLSLFEEIIRDLNNKDVFNEKIIILYENSK
jgi:hypothetical protein